MLSKNKKPVKPKQKLSIIPKTDHMILRANQLMTNATSNRFKHRFYTKSNPLWCIDETLFSTHAILFFVTCTKTTAILKTIFTTSRDEDRQSLTFPESTVELYEGILADGFSKPRAIHSDNNSAYWTDEIKLFCQEHNIAISTTQNNKFVNNQIESVNNVIKQAVVKYILENYNPNSLYKAWRKLWPPEFKHLKKQIKIGIL